MKIVTEAVLPYLQPKHFTSHTTNSILSLINSNDFSLQD